MGEIKYLVNKVAAGASSAVFRSLLLVSPPGLSRVQTEDIAHRGRITSD